MIIGNYIRDARVEGTSASLPSVAYLKKFVLKEKMLSHIKILLILTFNKNICSEFWPDNPEGKVILFAIKCF